MLCGVLKGRFSYRFSRCVRLLTGYARKGERLSQVSLLLIVSTMVSGFVIFVMMNLYHNDGRGKLACLLRSLSHRGGSGPAVVGVYGG